MKEVPRSAFVRRCHGERGCVCEIFIELHESVHNWPPMCSARSPVCTSAKHLKGITTSVIGRDTGLHVEERTSSPLKLFEHEERTRITSRCGKVSKTSLRMQGSRSSEYLDKGTSRHATDSFIQAIWNDSGEHYM